MMSELPEIADISNALRATEIAIGFLASTGGQPNHFYKPYLEDVLHMNAEKFLASGKVISIICYTDGIKHR